MYFDPRGRKSKDQGGKEIKGRATIYTPENDAIKFCETKEGRKKDILTRCDFFPTYVRCRENQYVQRADS